MKYAIQGLARAIACPPALKAEFGMNAKIVVITSGGEMIQLASDCLVVPIMHLHDYL